MLHAVFRLVSKELHYDQCQVEILRRLSTNCDKVICLSVCQCVCMCYMCVCMYICVHTYVYMYAYMHVCVCVCMCACMHVCVCINDIIYLQNGYPLVFLPTHKSHLDYVIL